MVSHNFFAGRKLKKICFDSDEAQFNDYAWNFWVAHIQEIKEPGSRILTALNQLDLCGLLNTVWRGEIVAQWLYVDVLRIRLHNFQCVAQWANVCCFLFQCI